MAAHQNLLILMLVAVVLLLPCSSTAAEIEVKSAEGVCPPSSEGNPLVTKDVISLTIKEIRQSRKFISEIPRLRSVRQHKPTKEIMNCVTGLADCLTDVYGVLKRVKHLKAGFLQRDVNTLRGSVSRVLGFSRTCHLARRDLENIFVVMLDRKLIDISLLVTDVVDLVSQLSN